VGGDEFVAVLQNSPGTKGIRAVAEKVINNLGEEINLGGKSLRVGASIGIAVFPEDGETLNSLLLNADKAMYKAKSRGRTRAVFFKD
jgi:diguanylate cyclase (GGDEF)-like protein